MKKRTKWTLEKLQEEALKYSFRSEFSKYSWNAYCAAQRRGVLSNICSHMHFVDQSGENHPGFKWTREKLQKEALKYKTKSEFRENNCGAYRASIAKNILDDICTHMKVLRKNWKIRELKKEAKKYTTRGEFAKSNYSAYSAANKMGILNKICVHMKAVHKTYTIKYLKKEAQKYISRIEFQTKI
jgi:predicted small metal-binding protein